MSDPGLSEKRRKLDGAPSPRLCGGHADAADDRSISLDDLRSILDERDRQTKELIDRRDEELRALVEERDREHEAKSAELQEQIDSILVFIQELMTSQDWYKNGSWEYPISLTNIGVKKWLGFDEDEAYCASTTAQLMIGTTGSLRVGGSCVDISQNQLADEAILPNHEVLLPHWKQLCSAICLSNGISDFSVSKVQFDVSVMQMIERTMRNKDSLLKFLLQSNGFDDTERAVGFATNIIKSNPAMKTFFWHNNEISDDDAASGLVDALVRHPNVKNVTLSYALQEVDSYDLVKELFVNGKEFHIIDMEGNDIRTRGDSTISDFLATNPHLRKLVLCSNCLNDADAMLFANALRTNNNLELLDIDDNEEITIAGHEELRAALFDYSAFDVGRTILNAVSDSNQTCRIRGMDSSLGCDYELNHQGGYQANKRAKLYTVFYYGNETGINTQMLRTQLPQDEKTMKLVPMILSSVNEMPAGLEETHTERSPLSIVFEMVSGWNIPEMFQYVFRGVEVEGCGLKDLNGFFRYAGYHNERPMYCRTAQFEGTARVFTLYRSRWKEDVARWNISICPVNGQPGTEEEVKFYDASSLKSEMYPPKIGWFCTRWGKKDDKPPPTLKIMFATDDEE
ncbi:hypothetical protein THAOC_07281 [Thalassiosira oceanica]|uniref:Uncharacterized protein n=1 Tax=Thalassiosira oceanica TaxID=159749 RepID=K0T0Q7_THAOC|nr:hypothetical protein THAOC_07281 [Thalassiosira oceanica]|eukprot:EJK71300.1 hypothetical protein THAOC_07281 [Thalassiosira oceanica]